MMRTREGFRLSRGQLNIVMLIFASCAAAAGAVIWSSFRARDALITQSFESLHQSAAVMNRLLSTQPQHESVLTQFSAALSAKPEFGLTISLLSDAGSVLHSSEIEMAGRDLSSYPDVRSALSGAIGSYQYLPRNVKAGFKRIAVSHPVDLGDARILRLSHDVEKHSAVAVSPAEWLMLSLLIAGTALALWLYFGSGRDPEMEELIEVVRKFRSGDLAFRADTSVRSQYASLALQINRLGSSLEREIARLKSEKSARDDLLSHLREGVVAVNMDLIVTSINRSAGKLLDILPEQASGMSVPELFRDIRLQRFAERALQEESSIEEEITVYQERELHIHAYSTILRDTAGQKYAVLIVLNDATHLKRLENIRRDFVANVSHELKTPITTIKGFTETLLEGAMHNKEELNRFLTIISRHAERLNQIIEDLLTLARMEQSEDRGEIEKDTVPLIAIVMAAKQSCEHKAADKKTAIDIECQENVMVDANVSLLEQAIVNLIDNAIKYTPENSIIKVQGRESEKGVQVDVLDQGPGIEKAHLERIFERFYRVDTARSRQHGGTGLGLAIVKHIAISHGGYVSADSTPGRGSRFTIFIPSSKGHG
ncbi:MAG: PAS domain-containing protein [Deltaproteobacteria bacterium]|nr:PAS domain-containing protein [Deltaproteobacteria bacterium]